LVFLVATYGVVTCYDTKDGKKLWEHDYQTDVNASPALVGERLILLTVEGTGLVLAAGREFKELAKSALGEKVYASPAFVRNRMIVRGVTNLFCIGTREAAGENLAKQE
jgi:outer membrane protein assembly factor BamB